MQIGTDQECYKKIVKSVTIPRRYRGQKNRETEDKHVLWNRIAGKMIGAQESGALKKYHCTTWLRRKRRQMLVWNTIVSSSRLSPAQEAVTVVISHPLFGCKLLCAQYFQPPTLGAIAAPNFPFSSQGSCVFPAQLWQLRLVSDRINTPVNGNSTPVLSFSLRLHW